MISIVPGPLQLLIQVSYHLESVCSSVCVTKDGFFGKYSCAFKCSCAFSKMHPRVEPDIYSTHILLVNPEPQLQLAAAAGLLHFLSAAALPSQCHASPQKSMQLSILLQGQLCPRECCSSLPQASDATCRGLFMVPGSGQDLQATQERLIGLQ